MKRLAIVTVLTATLAACGSTQWVKPGATQQAFAQDSYRCQRDSQVTQESVKQVWTGSSYKPVYNNTTGTDYNLYNSCMRAQGYTSK